MKLKNIIWFSLILVLFVGGCQLFLPPDLKTIVQEDYIGYWQLSPNGDYLVYGDTTDSKHFLLNLATNKKHEYDCRLTWWDTYLVGCYDNQGISVIDVNNFIETPLSPTDLIEVSKIGIHGYTNQLFMNDVLEQTELIYKPNWLTDTLYTLAYNYQLNPKQNHIITGITNTDEILEQYVYTSIPRDYPKIQESPILSPNGLYYCEFTTEGLRIVIASKKEVIAQYEEPVMYFEIGGWAADSSGVYFSTFQGGFGGSGVTKAIYKLKTPDD